MTLTLQERADRANVYKRVDPYLDDARGFDAGYKARVQEEREARISDEELLARFQEAVRQPNMIVGDAELCVKIAKEYADVI